MRLTVRLLGLDLFDVELTTAEASEDDCSRDLSGGYLGSERIETDRGGDCFMGFTNGLEDE